MDGDDDDNDHRENDIAPLSGTIIAVFSAPCWSPLKGDIPWMGPPPCNSDHQDYYMFSRGFLLTFTFHCYREGAIPNYIYINMVC